MSSRTVLRILKTSADSKSHQPEIAMYLVVRDPARLRSILHPSSSATQADPQRPGLSAAERRELANEIVDDPRLGMQLNRTWLHWAGLFLIQESIEILLDAGADKSKRDASDSTPFDLAKSKGGSVALLKLLVPDDRPDLLEEISSATYESKPAKIDTSRYSREEEDEDRDDGESLSAAFRAHISSFRKSTSERKGSSPSLRSSALDSSPRGVERDAASPADPRPIPPLPGRPGLARHPSSPLVSTPKTFSPSVSASAETTPRKDSGAQQQQLVLSYETLKARAFPEEPKLDAEALETYLSDEEFEKLFLMTKEAFMNEPAWKRVREKKRLSLF